MNNIDSFINYGLKKDITVTQIKKSSLGLIIFYIFGLCYGLMLGGLELIFGLIMFVFGLISTIFVQTINDNDSIKHYCKALGVVSLSGMINFSLLSLIMCKMLENNIFIFFIVAIIPYVFMLLLFFITVKRVNKGLYRNVKEIKKSNIRLYSVIGAALGYSFARTLFDGLDQTTVLTAIAIFSLFLSLLFCLGTINLLKLYYIKKFTK